MTAIRINLRTNSTSQYGGFDFNSMCVFRGRKICADSSGVYEIGVGDTDDGAQIDAWIEYPLSTLGTDHNKKVRRYYVKGEFSGPMELVARSLGRSEKTMVFLVDPLDTNLRDQTVEVPATFRQVGEHWAFTLRNLLGEDFSLDTIDAIVQNVVRRKGLRG